MNRIAKYGVELRLLEENDLELIRVWRNSDHVQSAMFFQDEISPEMQASWFQNLSENDRYFVVLANHQPIGVVHVKGIDEKKKSGEAGIFIGEEKFLKTIYPVAAVLALMDTFFLELNFEELTATVRNDNPEIIDFNLQLGYQIKCIDNDATRLVANRESYLSAVKKMRSFLMKK